MKAYRIVEHFRDGAWVRCEEPTSVPCWDEGWGRIWVARDSMGVIGFVRARTWEEAYSCCEDEIFPPASWDDVRSCQEPGDDPEELPEGFGWRSNGPASNFPGDEGIYRTDLNGEDLRPAPRELLADLGYRVIL